MEDGGFFRPGGRVTWWRGAIVRGENRGQVRLPLDIVTSITFCVRQFFQFFQQQPRGVIKIWWWHDNARQQKARIETKCPWIEQHQRVAVVCRLTRLVSIRTSMGCRISTSSSQLIRTDSKEMEGRKSLI